MSGIAASGANIPEGVLMRRLRLEAVHRVKVARAMPWVAAMSRDTLGTYLRASQGVVILGDRYT